MKREQDDPERAGEIPSPGAGESNRLELCDITHRYRDKKALDGVSLTLNPGIYGLLGPNGAGKSTLMNVICGNCRPKMGRVLWDGTETRKLGATYRSLLGYAPQQQGLYDQFSGRRFLAYMATLKGIPQKKQKEEIERVLDYVNMTDVAGRPMGTYSGGMKQRILIAQAILGDPKLLVLDEPTAGLDPRERVRIREGIRKLAGTPGTVQCPPEESPKEEKPAGDRIILVSTHVVSDIEPIAREVILLKEGKVAARGSVEKLCEAYHCSKGLEEVYLQVFGQCEKGNEDKGETGYL